MISIILGLVFICFLESWLILALHFINNELEDSLRNAINKGKELIEDKLNNKDCFHRSLGLLKKYFYNK